MADIREATGKNIISQALGSLLPGDVVVAVNGKTESVGSPVQLSVGGLVTVQQDGSIFLKPVGLPVLDSGNIISDSIIVSVRRNGSVSDISVVIDLESASTMAPIGQNIVLTFAVAPHS